MGKELEIRRKPLAELERNIKACLNEEIETMHLDLLKQYEVLDIRPKIKRILVNDMQVGRFKRLLTNEVKMILE